MSTLCREKSTDVMASHDFLDAQVSELERPAISNILITYHIEYVNLLSSTGHKRYKEHKVMGITLGSKED